MVRNDIKKLKWFWDVDNQPTTQQQCPFRTFRINSNPNLSTTTTTTTTVAKKTSTHQNPLGTVFLEYSDQPDRSTMPGESKRTKESPRPLSWPSKPKKSQHKSRKSSTSAKPKRERNDARLTRNQKKPQFGRPRRRSGAAITWSDVVTWAEPVRGRRRSSACGELWTTKAPAASEESNRRIGIPDWKI